MRLISRLLLSVVIASIMLATLILGALSQNTGKESTSGLNNFLPILLTIQKRVPISVTMAVPIEAAEVETITLPLELALDFRIKVTSLTSATLEVQPSEDATISIETLPVEKESQIDNVLTQPKGDGFYTVGVEIAPGTWHSTGEGEDCFWVRLDRQQEPIAVHAGQSGGSVTLQETDYEVEFKRCGTWEYIGPPE